VEWFFSPTNTAAAFFVYFFLLQKKSESPSGLRTLNNILPFICLVLELSFAAY
jgi:hypothetical protein